MDDVFIYFVPLPPKINEMVAPGADGYTVYISDKLDHEGRLKAYAHAVNHIIMRDFASEGDVQSIEAQRHDLPIQKPLKRKISAWEKYERKMRRKEKALEKMGLTLERYIADDEYGCPVVKYRARKW